MSIYVENGRRTSLSLSFPILGRVLRLRQPQRAHWTLSPGSSPPPKLPNSGQAVYMGSPLPALSSYSPSVALKEQLWEQRAGGLREGGEEGLRGPCSCLVTAYAGPTGAECSCRNWVTHMWQPLPLIC